MAPVPGGRGQAHLTLVCLSSLGCDSEPFQNQGRRTQLPGNEVSACSRTIRSQARVLGSVLCVSLQNGRRVDGTCHGGGALGSPAGRETYKLEGCLKRVKKLTGVSGSASWLCCCSVVCFNDTHSTGCAFFSPLYILFNDFFLCQKRNWRGLLRPQKGIR